MAQYKYLIVGGGAAGAYAARELVEQGAGPGEVGLLSEEAMLPYHRYVLSKAYMSERKPLDTFLVNRAQFYEEKGVHTRLGVHAARLDTVRRLVQLDDGEAFKYENLLVATGAVPRKLECPGAQVAPLHYLRNVRDAQAIRSRAEVSQRALLIGGGFTGLELGASLCRMGLEVTVAFMEDRLLPFLFTQPMHEFFSELYVSRGVTLLAGEMVTRVHPDGRVCEVRLESGRTIEADLVVVGIGVDPAVGIARNTPIQIDNGIVVDEFMHTSVSNVWAAGDVANYPDLIYGKRTRGEHLQNARDQARVAARNMMGQSVAFRAVPYYFTTMFEYNWEFWGDNSEADEVLHLGDLEHGSFSTWWVRDDLVRASFVMGRVDEERTRARLCVEEQREVPEDIRLRAQVNAGISALD